MNPKITICIPTYGKRIRNQLMVVRTLNSFLKLPSSRFRVILFNTTEPWDEKVNHNLNKIVNRFSEFFEIMQVTTMDLEHLRTFLIEHGVDIIKNVHFKGFSNMRNAMLMVAHILKSGIVIMIDDDEIVEYKDFIKKATEYIGKKYKKKNLFGKVGYYVYEETGYKLTQQSPKTRRLWLKETYINETLSKFVNSKTRLNETSIAFGGIMVLHSSLYKKIPFDPNILRGEDTDYIINARQFGYYFVLDNKLKIKHRPQKKSIEYWEKLRQDIYRFIYEKEKLKYFNKIDIDSLEPYPAVFLKDDLEYRAVVTSVMYAERYLKKKKFDLQREYFRNAKLAFTDARMKALIKAPRYFEFQKNWVKFMAQLPKFKELKKHFDRF